MYKPEVKNSCFLFCFVFFSGGGGGGGGKKSIKVLKLKDFKIKEKGSKTFQKRPHQYLKCLNIANLLNTNVAKIIKHQLHWGSNHLLSVKSIKINKEKGSSDIKLF